MYNVSCFEVITFYVFDIVNTSTFIVDVINECLSHTLIGWTQEPLVYLELNTQ